MFLQKKAVAKNVKNLIFFQKQISYALALKLRKISSKKNVHFLRLFQRKCQELKF